jgi:hypothetical protein
MAEGRWEGTMDVGLMMIFASYGWENIGDDQVWDARRLASVFYPPTD